MDDLKCKARAGSAKGGEECLVLGFQGSAESNLPRCVLRLDWAHMAMREVGSNLTNRSFRLVTVREQRQPDLSDRMVELPHTRVTAKTLDGGRSNSASNESSLEKTIADLRNPRNIRNAEPFSFL